VPNFSSITKPLTRLLEKGVPFVWSNDYVVSYQALKNKLVNAPILALPEVVSVSQFIRMLLVLALAVC
jgi:hypothetical protein